MRDYNPKTNIDTQWFFLLEPLVDFVDDGDLNTANDILNPRYTLLDQNSLNSWFHPALLFHLGKDKSVTQITFLT